MEQRTRSAAGVKLNISLGILTLTTLLRFLPHLHPASQPTIES